MLRPSRSLRQSFACTKISILRFQGLSHLSGLAFIQCVVRYDELTVGNLASIHTICECSASFAIDLQPPMNFICCVQGWIVVGGMAAAVVCCHTGVRQPTLVSVCVGALVQCIYHHSSHSCQQQCLQRDCLRVISGTSRRRKRHRWQPASARRLRRRQCLPGRPHLSLSFRRSSLQCHPVGRRIPGIECVG